MGLESNYDYFDQNVHVHRIKTADPHFVANCLIHTYQVLSKISQSGPNIDIIEAPEFRGEALATVLRSKIPMVTRLHTPSYLVNILTGKQTNFRFFARYLNIYAVNILEKIQAIYSEGITSPTKSLKEEVSQRWHIKESGIKVIPNGIDIKRIRSSKIEPISIEGDFITFVGRVETRKGVLVLAKALPGIFERFPNLKMVFVGDDMPYGNGTVREQILSINSKYIHRIIFTGFVTEERKKFSLIKNSKFVVLPSLWEAFGYTCLESMALGKAVIATKNSGFEEIIENNRSGFLVKPGDYKELQNQIVWCLEDEDRIKAIENIALRRAQDFDIVKISEDCLRYYESILKAQR